MAEMQIGLNSLLAALNALGEAIENDSNNALESARALSIKADIPVGWIARVELGLEVMARDGDITSKEAMNVIDTASKHAFIDPNTLDPFFMGNNTIYGADGN